jgi:phosphoribosylamine--glycine ligase
MRCSGIPTAMAEAFEESAEALRFAEQLRYPIVIKADGLALGKGVIVASNAAEATEAIRAMMEKRKFGDAGRRVLIEEFLNGWECSLHALVDGDNYQMLATACDYKRACDGNEGANTGGMGAFSPADRWDRNLEAQAHEKIMKPLLRGLREDGIAFRGLLFPGLMVTKSGAHVPEFNCRFGDPETQVILPRLKGDLLPLLEATIDRRLPDVKIEWDECPAVTVVMASGGYPGNYETGKKISGLEECARLNDVHIFHAGTRRVNDEVVTAGGRVLAVTALGETLAHARERAYDAVSRIHFEGAFYRRDIAAKIENPQSNASSNS